MCMGERERDLSKETEERRERKNMFTLVVFANSLASPKSVILSVLKSRSSSLSMYSRINTLDDFRSLDRRMYRKIDK